MSYITKINIEKLKMNNKQVKMRPFDRYLDLFKIHLAEFKVNELVHSQIIQEYSVIDDKGLLGVMKTKGSVLVFRGKAIGMIMEIGKDYVDCTFTSEQDAYDFREYLLAAYMNADKKLNIKTFEDEENEKTKKKGFLSFFAR